MTFSNPSGLWLLLGVPLLIIIYLIKNQHEDKAVSSTFIWKLSMRFAKKRLPIQRLRKIILFLLQLLLIVSAAIMAAKPVMVKGESCDYIAVIDGSASMMQKNEDGVSRFDSGLEMIEKLADDLKKGHTLTVILATDTPVTLVECTRDITEAKTAINNATCSFGGCDALSAMKLAQNVCDKTVNPKVLFYTDHKYSEVGDITVVEINSELFNLSVDSLEVEYRDGRTFFVSSLTCINRDEKVAVGLKIDGKTVDVAMVECKQGEENKVEFAIEGEAAFDVATVYVDTKDGLDEDNAYSYCKKNGRKFDVLLASNSPLYLQSAFIALGQCNVTVVSTLDDIALSGWDLYVFDGIYPESYPEDGSVMVFGCDKLPDGITALSKTQIKGSLMVNKKIENEIIKNFTIKNVVLNEYSPLVAGSDWQPLLYCNGSVVLSTISKSNGTLFSLFSFDLHNSNLPLKSEYLELMKRLADHSLPTMMERTDYSAGESVEIKVLPFTEKMYLEYPDERIKELTVSGDSYTVMADSIGVYTALTLTSKGGEYVDFFVHIPEGETKLEDTSPIYVVPPERVEQPEEVSSPVWFWVALAALMILLIEWGVYYREQY